MGKAAGAFILNLSKDGNKLRINAHEKTSEEEQPLKHYEEHTVSFDEIERGCQEIIALLNKANRRGDITPEIIIDLKKAGQALYDELLTAKAKDLLRATNSEILVLYLDDHLVHIPWELLFDGEKFLCLRFGIGRIVSTRQGASGGRRRARGHSLKMLVIADPQGNLDAAYREGLNIRDELSRLEDTIKVSLVSSNVDMQYIKKNIRDFDVVHYAGHADYDVDEPSNSGWLVSDRKWNAADIIKMAGSSAMPFVVFSNACQSGQTGQWHVSEGFENKIYGLANAFLLAGVTHYIGTFREILDTPGSVFAVEFYKALGEGVPISIALRNARKKLINTYGETSIIWLSYMLYGDPSFKPFDIKEQPEQETVLAGVSKEKQMDNITNAQDVFRSSSVDPVKRTSKARSTIIFGLLAVLTLAVILFSFKDRNKSVLQGPSTESQPLTMTASTEQLELSMNIIGQREEADGSVSEVIIKEGSILHSHDNFQVHFKTNKDAYATILIFDSSGEAHQLFPDPKIQLANNIKAGTEHSVPPADQWFWLDENIGTETIYVLASEKPLNDITGLLKEMERAGAKDKGKISAQIKERVLSMERGVGGVTEGKAKSFHLKDGKQIQRVTEVVKGKSAVVRAISFRHIDKAPFKDVEVFKKIQKGKTADGSLKRGAELSSASLGFQNRQGVTNERAVSKALQNVKRNIVLEESRGVGGVQVYKQASPSVVLVLTNTGLGSGSVIDKQGHVLTNWHVVKDYSKVAVIFKPKKGIEVTKDNAYLAEVIKLDEVADLALLKIEHPPAQLPAIKFGSMDNVEVAQDVHAIGHPSGEIWTYTKGIISQIRPEYEWTYDGVVKHKSKVIQTQTPISPGNSGGPLLNGKAEIIGVNSFVKEGEGLNYAVSVDVIKEFIARKESRIAQKEAAPDGSTGTTYIELDINEDGITDGLAFDTDKNGIIDMVIVDKDQDGKPDLWELDANGNGKTDVLGFDTNKNTEPDTWVYDTNEDGKIDLYGYDYDEDGEIDEYKEY